MAVGRRARWGAVRPLGGAAAAVLLLAVAAHAGPSWPSLSLLSVATPVLAIVGGTCLAMLAMQVRSVALRAGLASLAIVAVGGAITMLFDAGSRIAPPPVVTGDPALRVVSFNVHQDNGSPAKAADWIMARNADVVVLLEAARAGAQVAHILGRHYPHRVTCRGKRRCSTIILSRRAPVIGRGLARGDADNRRALSAAYMRVASGAGPVDVVAVHLSRPWPPGRQGRELRQLRAALSDTPGERMIVIGDFNAPPWSMTLRDAMAGLRLRRVPAGATWPVSSAASLLPPLLAIDQALVGSGLTLGEARTGPALGSDHLPLVVDLGVASR